MTKTLSNSGLLAAVTAVALTLTSSTAFAQDSEATEVANEATEDATEDAAKPVEAAPDLLRGTVVDTIAWTAATIPEDGTLVDGPTQGSQAVEVAGDSDGVTIDLASVQPKVTTLQWAVTGKVKFTGVEGDGYVQTNNFVGKRDDGTPQSYFTKTLSPDPATPMGKLNGSSDWRTLLLPFNANMGGNTNTLDKLEVKIVLPGKGTVAVSELEIRELSAADFQAMVSTSQMRGGWQAKPMTLMGRTMPTGQWIGLGGAVLGATIGIGAGLFAWLRSRKARAELAAENENRRMAAMDV